MFIVLRIEENVATYEGNGKTLEAAYNLMRNLACDYIKDSGIYQEEIEEEWYDEAHNLVTTDGTELEDLIFNRLTSDNELEFDSDGKFDFDNIINIGNKTIFQIIETE